MKKKKIFAAIDIGSYNCRLTIVEKTVNGIRIVQNFSRETNLIKEISYSNEFEYENIRKTLNCLYEISKKIADFKVQEYRCIATEACRQVINPDFFLLQVKKKTGLLAEIISSSEESRLSFDGCSKYHDKIKKFGLIIDIGGGSTELTYFDKKNDKLISKSISFGVVNLSEKINLFGIEYINKKFNNFFLDIKKQISQNFTDYLVIGSCSTITSIFAVNKGLKRYLPRLIEGEILNLDSVLETCSLIKTMTINDKKTHPCIGKNYFLLDNGILILKKILEYIPAYKILATHYGLRQGLINEYFK